MADGLTRVRRFNDSRVMNGTYGKCFFNNDFLAECNKCSVKVTVNHSDVNQCGTLVTGQKVTGVQISVEVTLLHIRSYSVRKVLNALNEGKEIEFTVMSELNDPNAYGPERYKISGLTLNELPIADWESGKLGEITLSGNATGIEVIDTADHEF